MDDLQVSLRKYQHVLAVVGLGVIVFGIWSIVKSAVYLSLSEPLKELAAEGYEMAKSADHESLITMGSLIFFLVIFNLVDLVIRWKVGKKAIAISRGLKTPTTGFFILTAIITVMDFWEFLVGFLTIIGVIQSEEDMTDRLSTLLMDLTSAVMLVEMIVAAVMILKITKEIADRKGGGQGSLQQRPDAA